MAEDKTEARLLKPFQVTTTNGDFVEGFDTKQEATHYCTDANMRAESLGVKGRYVVVDGPRAFNK